MKLRFSKKLLLVISGVFVLTGASGAAALYIGADTLLGPSYAEKNGLSCTEVTTVTIKKKDRLWIRKYIKTDEPGDGLARVRTALRVARIAYEKDEHHKPDLVQVVVLDKNGPAERSAMRGRAIGADVIFVPDPARASDAGQDRPFIARYVDKPAGSTGEFYGDRIFMTDEDIQFLLSKLDDKTDCVSPAPAAAADGHGAPAAAGHGAAEGGHGAPQGGHGAPESGHGAPKAESGGHGSEEASGDGAAEGHGAEAETSAEGKGWFASVTEMVLGGDEPAESGTGHDGQGDAAEEHGAATPAEEKGWFASVKGMVFGSEKEAAPTAEGAAAPASAEDGHSPKPAETPTKAEAETPRDHDAAKPEEQAATQTPAAKGKSAAATAAHDVPAEDSDVLPPKASDKLKGQQTAAKH